MSIEIHNGVYLELVEGLPNILACGREHTDLSSVVIDDSSLPNVAPAQCTWPAIGFAGGPFSSLFSYLWPQRAMSAGTITAKSLSE